MLNCVIAEQLHKYSRQLLGIAELLRLLCRLPRQKKGPIIKMAYGSHVLLGYNSETVRNVFWILRTNWLAVFRWALQAEWLAIYKWASMFIWLAIMEWDSNLFVG